MRVSKKCVLDRECECVFVCICVCEFVKDVCFRQKMSRRDSECVYECVYECVQKVCVRKRERERERKCVCV